MKIKVFGVLSEVVQNTEIETKPVFNTDSLINDLMHNYPLLKNYRFQVVVNQEKIEGNTLLMDGDDIALLPPYAGG